MKASQINRNEMNCNIGESVNRFIVEYDTNELDEQKIKWAVAQTNNFFSLTELA